MKRLKGITRKTGQRPNSAQPKAVSYAQAAPQAAGRRRSALPMASRSFPALYHPDCNRRLRTLTGSADPLPAGPVRALAGLKLMLPTAGGDFHPAPRTLPDIRQPMVKQWKGGWQGGLRHGQREAAQKCRRRFTMQAYNELRPRDGRPILGPRGIFNVWQSVEPRDHADRGRVLPERRPGQKATGGGGPQLSC
jgi:hypothetical protein